MSDSNSKTPENRLDITSKNFKSAQNFLNFFDYKITTIQVKQDRKQKTQPGQTLWTGDDGSSVCAYEGSILEHPDLMADITLHQNQGMALYFMVNEGDGIVYEGYKTPRTQKSVTTLKACFVDTDNGDIKKLERFARKLNAPYSLKVQTSPNRYHVYYRIEDTEATPDNVLKWEAIQRKLMSLDPLYDKSLADTSQLLRLPFFYHNKKAPYLIKVAKNPDAPIYTLDDLFEITEAHEFLKINGQGDRFTYPDSKIDSGQRHYAMVAYLRHFTNQGIASKDLLTDAALGFARRNFTDFKEFMPGGSRFEEVLHNVDSVLDYAENEKREESKALLEQLTLEEESKKESLQLPNDFYFDCPNKMIGEIIRHTSSGAMYPCPAYDFAATLAMLGYLKSHLFKSSLGHYPINYFLCLGQTGIGKNHSQSFVSKALYRLGETSGLASAIKTEKGLYRGLSENRSRYFVMMDEIELLLSFMTSDGGKVETYTRALKQALMQLYTHGNRSYTSALTGNEKDKVYHIPNPHLNLIGYGTLSALTHGFTLKSITDGLLPRFIIIAAKRERKYNENFSPDIEILPEHLNWIRDVMMAGKGRKEKDFLEIEELTTELDELTAEKAEGQDLKDNKARIKEIKERLLDLDSKSRVIGSTSTIPFTDKAERRYVEYIKSNDRQIVDADEDPLAELKTRSAEKVGRLATVIAVKEINTQILDWCIEFIDRQVEAEIALCGTKGINLGGGGNREEKEYQKLLLCIERLGKKDPIVKKRDISRSMHIGSSFLDKLLDLGVEREELLPQKARNSKGVNVAAFSRKESLL